MDANTFNSSEKHFRTLEGPMIRKLRKEHGLTQKQLASILYVTHQSVSSWERGETKPSLDNAVRLCEVLMKQEGGEFMTSEEYEAFLYVHVSEKEKKYYDEIARRTGHRNNVYGLFTPIVKSVEDIDKIYNIGSKEFLEECERAAELEDWSKHPEHRHDYEFDPMNNLRRKRELGPLTDSEGYLKRK